MSAIKITRMIKFSGREEKPAKQEKYVCDRTGWPAGEWDNEPKDRIDFIHAGFACLMLRGNMGNWCGYTGLPEYHPLYGKDYNSIDGVEVHGGLTYADECNGRICHVAEPGMPEKVWWLGFDCAHCGDAVPGLLRYQIPARIRLGVEQNYELGDTYKNIAYVKAETERLAEQLREMA